MDKRERQRRVRERKREEARRRDRKRRLAGRIALFGAAPALLLAALYVLFTREPVYSPVEIADSDHVRGAPGNPVVVVVYGDFQCPACATEHRNMMQAWPSIEDEARLVFRHFPLTAAYPHSWEAALYAEAAGRQGRFWEMHDYLYATQPAWSALPEIGGEFDDYARELGLDLERLRADMASGEVIAKIRGDQRGGNASGVRSTPTVFVDGRLLTRPTRARIVRAVQDAAAGD